MHRSEQARKEKHAWLYEAEKRHAETTKEILQLEDGKDKPLAITDGATVWPLLTSTGEQKNQFYPNFFLPQ